MLGFWVFKLFAVYVTDVRWMDGQKQRLLPLPYGRGNNNCYSNKLLLHACSHIKTTSLTKCIHNNKYKFLQ